jgi:hypothetical protein
MRRASVQLANHRLVLVDSISGGVFIVPPDLPLSKIER